MVVDLLEPLKAYNSSLNEEHKNNTIEYFNSLVVKSGIDIEANKETVKKYYKVVDDIKNVSSAISKKRGLKTFLIIMTIVLSIIAFGLFFLGIELYIPIISVITIAGLDVLFIILIIKLKKEIKTLLENKNQLVTKSNELKSLAEQQMKPLNILFDWNMPNDIINMSNTIIKMDKFFDINKYIYLKDKFGLDDNSDPTISTLHVQSGEILGNPFLICKDLRQTWFDKVYTGSITIHWTERVKTKDGWKTVHRSQVLTASVTKPCPQYTDCTYLIYGNEAASNLVFSRKPSNLSGLEEKKQDKKVAKEAKKLDNRAKKELMDNDDTTNYSRFSNDEFEVIFGGTDRNNELEYRLLFTPLAQRNILDILNNSKPFGDDFHFNKDKKLNFIQSKHSQTFDYKKSPSWFRGFDYEEVKKKFVDYNDKYFEAFYFDLAPLISIPLYQQTKTKEYIYDEVYEANVPTYEHETLANGYNPGLFKHPKSATTVILKSKIDRKLSGADEITITAHSFEAIEHVDIIMKMGGDGRLHGVPVKWYEYLPLVQETKMLIQIKDSSNLDYINLNSNESFRNLLNKLGITNHRYERGLFSLILKSSVEDSQLDSINDIFKSKDEKKEESLADKLRNAILNIKDKIEDLEESVDMNVSNADTVTSNQVSNT